MLTSMRKGAQTWIAAVFIFLLAGSFAVWGVGDWIGGALVQDVATIGDKKITQTAYRRAYDREMQTLQRQLGRVIQRDQARLFGVDQRVLGTLLGTAALELHGDELKLGLTEKAVAARIARDPAFQAVGDGGFDADRFRQTLQMTGMSEGEFAARQRQGLIRQQLTGTITSDIAVPKTMLNALNDFENETRVVDYIVVTPEQAETVKEPSKNDLKDYYKDNESKFTAPEYRKVAMIVLKPDDFKSAITVADEDVKQSFEARENEFNTPEKRTVEQLNFTDQAAADKAYQELQGGKDFDKLADELGREDRLVNLGSVAKGGIIDSALADAAFALEKPGYSKPIKGALATAILRVKDITPAVVQTFDDVKEQVKNDLINERAADAVADLFDQIEDDRIKGLTLENISSKRDVDLIEVPAVDADGNAPDGNRIAAIPENPRILTAISTGEIDLQGEPVELSEESFAWTEVLGVTPPKLRPFDQVKDDVKADWIDAEMRSAVSNVAKEMIKQIDGGTPLANVAEKKSLTVKTSSPLRRSARDPDLATGAIGQIFTLGVGGSGSAEVPGTDKRAVFVLKEIKAPEPLAGPTAENVTSALRSRLSEEMVAQYLADLQARYNVEVNQAAIEQATDPARSPVRGGY